MGFHSKGQVKSLQRQLTAAYERVMAAMDGRDSNPDKPEHDSKIERLVNGQDIRLGLSELDAISKEIRADLGKR